VDLPAHRYRAALAGHAAVRSQETAVIALQELNSMPVAQFVAALSGVFEKSPWIPQAVAGKRPFDSALHLHEAMCGVVLDAAVERQLALIRAHPELAGRAAVRGELTPESTREQRGAGLSACTPEELGTLQTLNAQYGKKFGFPFVIAVRGHHPGSVIAALQERIAHAPDDERMTALHQIGRIAGFRLADLVTEPLGAQIMAQLESLARFSEQEDGLTCSYLSATHRATAQQIREWMLAAGLEVHIDAVGNVIGRLRSAANDAATLITGSHYDTVVNGGKYDGRLGIILPVVAAGHLRRTGVQLPYTLEIIAFAEEEGVRFKSTFLGSSAVAGTFNPAVLDNADAAGVRMRDAMRAAGLDAAEIRAAARDPRQLLGFIEVHIEQGPVLLSENEPLGVVTSIAGSVRGMISVSGLAGHAGTVPMNLRRDAAAAAAEIILVLEKRCSEVPGLVGTVGRLEVPGGAINVIPGRCELSFDIRSDDDAVRDAAFGDVCTAAASIASRRNVAVRIRKVLEISRVPCAPQMQRRWADSIRRITGVANVRSLPSGAGHDAMVMASVADMGMLFVRCGNGGISHHPAENMSEADADLAARVFMDFLTNFATPA
jgi:beta-ureidopropionase / N-carbamoyl-L-amino-acid hydrolase